MIKWMGRHMVGLNLDSGSPWKFNSGMQRGNNKIFVEMMSSISKTNETISNYLQNMGVNGERKQGYLRG